MSSPHMSTVRDLARDISTGSIKDRDKAIEDLTNLLRNNSVNLTALEDKSYHDILEAIFNVVLKDKSVYHGKKNSQSRRNSAASRLSKCATAVRLAVSRGVSKLKLKTLLAVIDHITQTLVGFDKEFVAPLFHDYVKALVAVLSRPAHVELLARKDAVVWRACVDFLIKVAEESLPEKPASLTCSTGPSPSSAGTTPRPTAPSQRRTSSHDGGPLRDSLVGLQYLVEAANAPLGHKAKLVTDLAVKVLDLQNLSLGPLQTMSFAIANTTFAATEADDFNFACGLVRQLLPLMSHWWRADKASHDDLIRGLRNEISRSLFLMHLHVQHLAINCWDEGVRDHVENLSDTLWSEYSRRCQDFGLQLNDVTFYMTSLPSNALRLEIFGLHNHSAEGEGNWALLQNLGFLEAVMMRPRPTMGQVEDQDADGQSRKKPRLDNGGLSRFKLKLTLRNTAVQRTALQLIPFLLANNALEIDNMVEILTELTTCASRKNADNVSWAFVACASLLSIRAIGDSQSDTWRQLWRLASRCLSLPSMSRAACLLLHAILKERVLPVHTLSGDINSFVTAADVHGPAVLCDTSMALMLLLFHERNARLPNASQTTSSQIIRWAFLKWLPDEPSYATSHSMHVRPIQYVNLLRACCGLHPISSHNQDVIVGSTLSAAWKVQGDIAPFNKYLLLIAGSRLEQDSNGRDSVPTTSALLNSDPSSFYASRNLVVELFHPKLQGLVAACSSWSKRPADGGSSISLEWFHSILSACIAGVMLVPLGSDVCPTQSSSMEQSLIDIAEKSIMAALNSVEPEVFVYTGLQLLRQCIPNITTHNLNLLYDSNNALVRMLCRVSGCLEQTSTAPASNNGDSMHLDDEFVSQGSKAMAATVSTPIPRQNIQMAMSARAFTTETKTRLCLLKALDQEKQQCSEIPDCWVRELLSMPDNEIFLCQGLLIELSRSDLAMTSDNLRLLVRRMGEIMGKPEYQCCEVVLSTCIEILSGWHQIWLNDSDRLAEYAGDLYTHFIKINMPCNVFSPPARMAMVNLLLTLLRANPDYGEQLKLDSCRTSLLYALKTSTVKVKCFIADRLASIFELYILELHEEVFVDVLECLPSDAEDKAGIVFRLLALSKMAMSWPTLLRRCAYHIFEIPGKIPWSTQHAKWCLAQVSDSLGLESAQDLFRLFCRQILYTWMESNSIDTIPFSIFGFCDLEELLQSTRGEAIAIALMRGQEQDSADIAEVLGLSETELILENFPVILSYCMIYSYASRASNRGEDRIKSKLGPKRYAEALHASFVDIVALFMGLVDNEDPNENALNRIPELDYAVQSMAAIKQIAHSKAKLPPDQQPKFRAKHVFPKLLELCKVTEFELSQLWTPALVASVVRKLLGRIHPAMGSLNACSALRKVRLLVCLAGPTAFNSYCLEMLLNSLRVFMVDSECADDVIGVSEYLLGNGNPYLSDRPCFVAGYALSALASLRVFLESSQSSTTEEDQFKATMIKAQQFHAWLVKYLSTYNSTRFVSVSQLESFQAIIETAGQIKSSGNADNGSPEGKLLLHILKDDESCQGLLNESSRKLALGLLCGDFNMPTVTNDMIESDDKAICHAGAVWKSCQWPELSSNYLAWAGRVVGRSFAASGGIPDGILRESQLDEYQRIAQEPHGSEAALLHLIEVVTSNQDSGVAGLAEAVLRLIVSQADMRQDQTLAATLQRSLSESLVAASNWDQFPLPPSEVPLNAVFQQPWPQDIGSPDWKVQLSVYLAQSVPASVLLSVMPVLLSRVAGFAHKAFPFLVHMVLCSELDGQRVMRQNLSGAIKKWLPTTGAAAQSNLRLLINTILYLRTQEFPNETSIEDRLRWLKIDFAEAASTATRCGMYKTALLFAEIAMSEGTPSARSSCLAEMKSTLLTIYENIDDPDTYYGLPEEASLTNVLARVEYEQEGSKSLAFRGAQYDENIRLRSADAQGDAQALVVALGTLGHSGISHSVLQNQQNLDGSVACLESTFGTARRLEIWDLPAPCKWEHHSVSLYKAYQALHQATELPPVRSTIHDGLGRIMQDLAGSNDNATKVRGRLAALASLTELEDGVHVGDEDAMEVLLSKFKLRDGWMRSGRYDDVSQILSCRETMTSMLSQHPALVSSPRFTVKNLRQLQVETMLMASTMYRHHGALQESLAISTALNKLIAVCQSLELHVDAAIDIDIANSLWDHGEMSTSIRMLQKIDKDSCLEEQSIPVSRCVLLSKIGDKISIARLEKPRDIQKTYLEPALKELRRQENRSKEAGAVYHQFAMFCDGQLQDTNGQEDLKRLHSLRQAKSDEVAALKALIASTTDKQNKLRYSHALAKEKQWLDLDEQELKRVEQTRSEFVRLSLENYLLSMQASDDYKNDALRFTALWLERWAEEATNKAVSRHLPCVPTAKFAGLMNQLSSRLQNEQGMFQKVLMDLVYSICRDHPYHGMYQIWSGIKAKAQETDQAAVLRVQATEKVAQRLQSTQALAKIWLAIDKTSRQYHAFAMDKSSKYKMGAKLGLKETPAGAGLMSCLDKFRIPPPTMHIAVSAAKDYSQVPVMCRLEPCMSIASGVSAPKIITAIGSDGLKYKQLVKGGHDDLRQDAIMEQVFAAVSSLLQLHKSTQQRSLGIRTYKVLPLTATSGLIEFVADTTPLHEFLMPAHERYFPRDIKSSECRKDIFAVQSKTFEVRMDTYRKVTQRFHPVMRFFFMEHFVNPDEWFARQRAYTRSTAAVSMLGHVLGLGDRHCHNILLDTKTGEVVHIDLGVAFEAGRILPVPELVPFRLTRDIVDGMGITKTEGVFRRCCEFTLHALREEQYSIMTILDVLRYDPLYTWTVSPLRLAKLNKARQSDSDVGAAPDDAEPRVKDTRSKGKCNEPSEADRALEVVRKKLSKTLSVTATVNDLIHQASDERNLAVLYSGWAAWA
ncbi:hypothetical protein CDD81_2628 [Ophiocordyceps australis]|uniref:Serine/threonine-protein kinase Tel1 n=1 Tax=Ophiocordyceps australis TaxID=1399860 RepID=A0A2C5XYF6_9HYPO|nr:hypothetical protein CDD81_2628 [Ophiocordyceps australis]